MKIPKLLPLAAGVIAFGLLGCASTTFTSSWKAPDAKPLQFAAGDRVVTLVLAEAASIRRSGEANLADELDRRGMKGVPAYTLLPEGEIKDEAKARAAIEGSGAVGVIVVRPMGSEQKVTTTPSTYYSAPYYSSFWGGGGYYGYGWNDVWIPGETRTDTYVFVETLVYDLRQNKLVWAGQTKTMNPDDVEGFVAELADAVAGELRASGLLVGAK